MDSLDSANLRKDSDCLLESSFDEGLSSVRLGQPSEIQTNFGKLNRNFPNLKKSDLENEIPMAKSILIVDDDCFNLNVLEALLSKLKYNCVKASNGQEAIDLLVDIYQNQEISHLNQKGFQLILMDYQMPILDGVEATKIIMQMIETEQIPEIPVVACTAFGSKEDYEKLTKLYKLISLQSCLAAGMKDIILKPIKPDKLLQTINKWSK